MNEFEAITEGGPLGGDVNLRVDKIDGHWARTWTFRTGPGPEDRHVYKFVGVSGSRVTGGAPVYRFDRTLGPDDAEPEVAPIQLEE